MKLFQITVLGLLAVFFLPSCATAPRAPLASGELRLLNLEIPQNGTVSANVEYLITIPFEADGRPEIRQVCYVFSDDPGYCHTVETKEITHGPHGDLRVPLHVPLGSNRLDVYVEYIRNDRAQRTNIVSAHVRGYEVR